MTRCHWNTGLQELYLRKCDYLYPDDVDLLKEIVVDVDWDEIDDDDDDDEHHSTSDDHDGSDEDEESD
jgi:hypothetical protein